MRYKIPRDIWAALESAESWLNDAAALPPALKHNALRYFSYIKAWELYTIADEQFSAWANKRKTDPKLFRDHGFKLEGSPRVTNITIKEGKPIEVHHSTGDEKNQLLQTLIYGKDGVSRSKVFERGWFFDTFNNRLKGKIELLRVVMQSLERYDF
jgi:hypothetical protein